eukprot:augustus_masked-scaffold_35-processed-gene-2.72-mRNA-1 protein AED:0.31 eAED:0.41 QI:0/-1/0/1/-1/1/1/0/235
MKKAKLLEKYKGEVKSKKRKRNKIIIVAKEDYKIINEKSQDEFSALSKHEKQQLAEKLRTEEEKHENIDDNLELKQKIQKVKELREKRKKLEEDAEHKLLISFNKGEADVKRQVEKAESEERIKRSKFSQNADDKQLNEQQKNKIRSGDPMAHLLAKKTRSKKKKKKKKKSGERDILIKKVYCGPPAPSNRFGIKPGYRWDGVDRSNGFEHRYLQKQNSIEAKKLEIHRQEHAHY